MLLVAITVGTLTAMVAVVALPIVVTPASAITTLNAVLVSGIRRNRHQRKYLSDGIFKSRSKRKCFFAVVVAVVSILTVTVVKIDILGIGVQSLISEMCKLVIIRTKHSAEKHQHTKRDAEYSLQLFLHTLPLSFA